MYKICVFAGTTEGRAVVEFLTGQEALVTACVATEYGETLLAPADNLTISAKRLTESEMVQLFADGKFDLVVDATHPYAEVVTENIESACSQTNTAYLRLLREQSQTPQDAVFVPDIASAVSCLNETQGNILLTTGSKELSKYIGISDFENRVYARVLPLDSSLIACKDAGLKPAHIIAMQGPFSIEMNLAMMKAVSAKFLVTKDGGDKGGFEEKVQTVREAGAKLVVIGRPAQKSGLGFAQTVVYLVEKFGFVVKPQVSVVGIGPGSKAAMTQEVQTAIAQADCLIGAKRMLDAVSDGSQLCISEIAPRGIAQSIKSHPEYQKFTIVMSGDVGFFSGTKKLLPLLCDCKVEVLPGLSSFVYLCAKLQTSYEDVLPVSVHGREHNIVPDIQNNRRVFALVGGENGMKNLCQLLCDAGLGFVKMGIGEHLSYPDEKITIGTASELADNSYETLSVALIENEQANPVVTHGLPDDAFQRGAGADGVVPMTKSEVRSVSLSKLRLTEHAVCWDIGAGTGSVAIEMALQAKGGAVYAIERKEAAVALLQENKVRFGVENLHIVSGYAPDACRDLPAPTHVFIGGSAGNMREIIALLLDKNPNVRIVATAIALESVAELTNMIKEFAFVETEVVSLSVARDRKAGPYHLMTGQNPIYIFTLQAGGNEAC